VSDLFARDVFTQRSAASGKRVAFAEPSAASAGGAAAAGGASADVGALLARIDALESELAARDESVRLHKEMVASMQEAARKLRAYALCLLCIPLSWSICFACWVACVSWRRLSSALKRLIVCLFV
jgi:hypothetical protein